MARTAGLLGVVHNIAHHAASGLSYLYPHLADALRTVGEKTTEIDLLLPQPYPPNAAESKPLRLALGALKEKAGEILKKSGFSFEDVVSLVLHVTPAPWCKDGSILHTRAVISATDNRQYDSGWL